MSKNNQIQEKNVRPFIKWAGGKTQIIDELIKRLPKKYNNYYEAFLGGGALLFALTPKRAFIGDLNKELVNAYEVIKNNAKELTTILDNLEASHNEEEYYKIRELDRADEWEDIYINNPIFAAGRFIYLNKAGFNGLYRVNKSGYFNVPSGKKEVLRTYNKENIENISSYLNNNEVFISHSPYNITLSTAKKGDFVYIDPPYDNSWSDYTSEGFNRQNQQELKEELDRLNELGVKWMYSNNATDFIKELFKDYIIEEIDTRRSINSNGKKRNNGKEVIIRNYKE